MEEARLTDMYDLSKKNAERESEHGQEVIQHGAEVPFRKINAHQKHIACLCVGENTTSLQIRVGVHESAGQCQQDTETYGF